MIKANIEYLSKVANLTEVEIARLLTRMRGEALEVFKSQKLSSLEAIAAQLKVEDEQLQQWRENKVKIFKNL